MHSLPWQPASGIDAEDSGGPLRPPAWRQLGLAMILFFTFASADNLAIDETLIQRVKQIYGGDAATRVSRWQDLMQQLKDQPEPAKLKGVNDFFNQLTFVPDTVHWGTDDYWATPVEFLGSNGGDCEDFSVAKYFTLKALDIPVERMNITYVKSLVLNQAHMVVTYFANPDAEPLVLDNLINQISPASQRRDLLPIYSFNGENLWLAKERGQGRLVGKSSRLSRWKGLTERMERQDMKVQNN